MWRLRMETNTCNLGHHPDTDALLPPRKRLLAGFKRQNSDISSPLPSKIDIPLKARFMAHINDSNLSIEEIVEVSGIGAIEAAKVAEAAKAKAEEKAAKAAKAIAAAKSALDLVATLTNEAAKKEKCLRRNKMKKHISVEELYSNNKGNSSCGTDEELARDLHRSISNNNSPRILTTSDVKIHKHKKLNGAVGNLDTEGSVKEIGNVMIDLSTSSKSEQSYQLKASSLEVSDGFGKTRRKIKQKKLPLSICSFRDRNAVEGEIKCKGNPLLGDNSVATDGALFSSATNLTTVERASMWKCQSMKAPACLKQNKVMRS